jgi:sulfide:quinone oxidoreductase
MRYHVVILGAGFAGLELASRLSVGDELRVTLIDQGDSFYFGFSKLDVLFGEKTAGEICIPYREISHKGIEFRQETVTRIDPASRRVTTDRGAYDADLLVIALGAVYDRAATPGFEEGGFEFYSLEGAERLRDALAEFESGTVLISVLGQPYKCPPAPFEAAFLLHHRLVEDGIRDKARIRMTYPMSAPVPVTPEVSAMFLRALDERGIEYEAKQLVVSIDPERREAQLADGGTVPYHLFIGIPVHRAPDVIQRSGLAEKGWVQVDQTNLTTRFPGVYALGDVATGARTVAKAGVFAEAAARVVGEDIVARMRGGEPPAPYEGAGNCYVEFGGGLVGKVEANFLAGPAPTARLIEPSLEVAAEKQQFGSSRQQRWFGRSPAPVSA